MFRLGQLRYLVFALILVSCTSVRPSLDYDSLLLMRTKATPPRWKNRRGSFISHGRLLCVLHGETPENIRLTLASLTDDPHATCGMSHAYRSSLDDVYIEQHLGVGGKTHYKIYALIAFESLSEKTNDRKRI